MRPATSGKLAYAIAELPELVSLGRSHLYEKAKCSLSAEMPPKRSRSWEFRGVQKSRF
jgi:hypothetical protein